MTKSQSCEKRTRFFDFNSDANQAFHIPFDACKSAIAEFVESILNRYLKYNG